MKKTYRNIILIVLVILLLCGGLYAVTKIEPKTDDPIDIETPTTVTIFKTEKDNISSVKVTNPEETYTLVKQGEKWVVSDNASIELSTSNVDSFLYECANVVGQELITDNATELSQYGLDKPERTVEIKLQDGSLTKILIGVATFENSVSYIMVEGETKVYTRSTSGCVTLTKPLSDLMDKAIYVMPQADVGFVKIQRDGGETITLDRVKMSAEGEDDAYEWTMRTPVNKKANTYRIESELLTNLLTQSAVSLVPVPQSGADYGFESPRAVYTITSLDKSISYTVTIGKAEGANTYLRLQGKQAVYLVGTKNLDFLNLSYLDLVDKLVHVENIKDVAEVRLSGLGKSFTLTIPAEGSGYKINNQDITEDAFKNVYQAVIGLLLDDFSTGGGGETVFTITYKKRDGVQNVVKCLNYDDRNYLVTVNGTGNLLIRKKQVDNIITTIESALAQ